MSDPVHSEELRRVLFRLRNLVGRVTLNLGSDAVPGAQLHQVQGYPSELHNNVQRVQQFGLSAMPPIGASGVILFQGGHRGFGTIVAAEHGAYRPTGLKPGEITIYMVDGAAADGTGGTMRRLLTGALGWVAGLFGKTITIGDADTQTIAIGTSSTTITVTGSSVTITGATGDVVVDGVSLLNHVHTNVAAGTGQSGPPAR